MPHRARSVAEEIQQSRPWSGSAEESLVSVLRTASLIRRALAQAVAGAGISPAQYNVLRILRGAEPDGLATLAVRARLLEEAPGITRLIDKLERAKHVRRERTAQDRRTVKLHITASGLALLDEVEPAIKAMQQRAMDAIPDEAARQELVRLLAELRAAY